ncbi:MAG: bacillithiol biosynthesis deacetylase BshB1 [Bacteroidota bacterium]
MKADILAIGAHPDDIELSCGGIVAKLAKQGRTVVLADLTQGELGTRGTKEVRAQEAEAATKIMGAAARRNLGLPDGSIERNGENLLKVISLIREFQPDILLIPHSVERHPDHVHTHALCKEAWFYSGLEKIKTEIQGVQQQAHRPHHYFEFMQWYEFVPSFIVDISDTWELKIAAIKAHSSQFHNPNSKEPETKLSTPEFLEMIEVRSRYYGERIGVRYGEPLFSWAPFGINDLSQLILSKG